MLLHAPPLSSRSLSALIAAVASDATALAIDLPGYGSSDPLAVAEPQIADYAHTLVATLDALGVEHFALYGAEVGALVALELAASQPGRVSHLVLDRPPVWTDAERIELAERLLPAYAPQADGSHLLRMWMRHRDEYIFSPWYRQERLSRRDVDMPDADELHQEFLDLLRAGVGYGAAHAAAFRYEDVRRRLAAVEARVMVVACEGDEFATHLERLEGARADAIRLLPRETDHWAEVARQLTGPTEVSDAKPDPASRHIPGRLTKDYADTSFGQILLRRAGWENSSAVPLIMFHGGYSSGAWYEQLVALMARHRPVAILDTLGNGDSDKNTFLDAQAGDYAQVVAEVIEGLGCSRVNLFGSHGGAVMAVETSILLPGLVGRVILDGLPMFSPEMIAYRMEEYLEPFQARSDGGHLPWAWSYVRDAGLYWPATRRKRDAIRLVDVLDVETLHQHVIDVLKAGITYSAFYRLALSYDARERLPLLTPPTLVCATAQDQLWQYVEEESNLVQQGVARTLPLELEGRADIFEEFLRSA